MLFTYNYEGQTYKVFIHWTADTGNSTVFKELVQRVSDNHQFKSDNYHERAEYLDALTDKLYEQFYIFSNEHSGTPYNPRFRKSVLRAFSEISDTVKECMIQECSEYENLLVALFADVADKFREMMGIYLDDSAYQCKFRERMRDKEEYLETTTQNLMSCEFEDILIQMTDLSSVLDCLTAVQRRRLVKHIFLKYTLQEIADNEHATKQSVQESIATALRKIRQRID